MRSFAHLRLTPALILFTLVSVLLAACQPAAPEGITPGADAPPFTLPAADGREVALADYAGTPVLLFFHMAMG